MLFKLITSLLMLSIALVAAVPSPDSHNSWRCHGLEFTGQKSCTKCSKEGNIVCGLDNYDKAKLKCTHLPTGLIWVPVKNPKACDVDYSYKPAANCPTKDLPFTGQAGCSKCAKIDNIVCGRDEDRVTQLKCTQLGSTPVWIPVDNPEKCGV